MHYLLSYHFRSLHYCHTIVHRLYGVSRYITLVTHSTYASICVHSLYSSNAEVLSFLCVHFKIRSTCTTCISRTYVIRQFHSQRNSSLNFEITFCGFRRFIRNTELYLDKPLSKTTCKNQPSDYFRSNTISKRKNLRRGHFEK